MVIPPWVFGRRFLNEMIVFVADDKIHAFKWKLEFCGFFFFMITPVIFLDGISGPLWQFYLFIY